MPERDSAFLKTLHLDDIVTGTVTRIADFGVTFVDLGGFEAKINIPELSTRRLGHPSEKLSVGQQVRARVVNICFLHEQVSLSLRNVPDPARTASPPNG
ncbi:S1 RNA-binding domain-containing protein [Streptomyces spiramenti]|uniref:S1 RNA-binding domain-containing protein n=1 Tax=Streptomyces spiramenti TaxID=2720606 RepID=A0ABX1AGD7_9ACTN|nr:S1 RNA-binding domain-containing protein [Streptomyces spiramenti]NJP64939.1 S1 RNA-binding domain-containing protein [Streptomyces spiramenti]